MMPRAIVTYDYNEIRLHIYDAPPTSPASIAISPSTAILLAQQLLTQALLWQTHHPTPATPQPEPPNSAPQAMTPTSQVA